ncbi:MFS transporter [Rugamonas sp.]|uniref:MFS transporter n=1 Tax=Rugamonas sp. TaxID=1926287 RepID=UPI0025D378E2|nr:MFS transporter [Rugamonas sp.]
MKLLMKSPARSPIKSPAIAPPAAPALSRGGLLWYGQFGLPLAMVALPIYVYVPQFYALRSGLTLAAIGAVLLAARLVSALIDPALGWWMERRLARGGRGYGACVAWSLAPLLLGFGALFHPPALAGAAALGWFSLSLLLVYFGFGLATIAHQSWGAALTQQAGPRARVTAAREGCGLLGVMLAAALASAYGYDALSLAFAIALLVGAAGLLARAPKPARSPSPPAARPRVAPASSLLAPWRVARFRSLYAVLMLNGVAAAIPATLFLFFVQDRLRLGAYAGAFLVLYFACAAASMAAWAALAQRIGEARAWLAAMLLAAGAFVWAAALGAGDAAGYGLICALSGAALGADLALPPALLAGVIAQAGDSGKREAAYFGWWNWGVQMNLALAAGIALPLLQWYGYAPGTQHGVAALSAAYALLPCALKLLAALLLWRAPLRDC